MATPIVAGAAALVRQYYVEGWGNCGASDNVGKPNYVSAALVKATIINSGVLEDDYVLDGSSTTSPHIPLNSSYPLSPYFRGHGRLQLDKTLRFKTDTKDHFFWDVCSATGLGSKRVGTGGSQTFTFNVPTGSPAGEVRVALVWTDPAPSLLSGKLLVNDLDLVVKSPSNVQYKGNLLYGQVTTRDSLNNVERVIATSETGDWQVTVSGNSVPINSPQDYAVVASAPSTAFTGRCGDAPPAIPGPTFTSISAASTTAGIVISGSLSAAGTVYYYTQSRATSTSYKPPSSPEELKKRVDYSGGALRDFVSGSKTTGAGSFTVTISGTKKGETEVYVAAADGSGVLQPSLTVLPVYAQYDTTYEDSMAANGAGHSIMILLFLSSALIATLGWLF